MEGFSWFLLITGLGLWVGAVVFFSFVVAPSVFSALPREQAGDVVGKVFPRYYVFGYVAGAVALVGSIVLLKLDRLHGLPGGLTMALLGAMLALSLAAGAWVQPRASELRLALRQERATADLVAERKTGFDRLHALSVRLNVAVLALGVATLGLVAYQLVTRTPEPPPPPLG